MPDEEHEELAEEAVQEHREGPDRLPAEPGTHSRDDSVGIEGDADPYDPDEDEEQEL